MGIATRSSDVAPRLRAVAGRCTVLLGTAHRPVVADVAVVLLTLGFALGHDLVDGTAVPTIWLFDCALVVPLFWRRRYPIAVFGAVAAICLLQWSLDVPAASAIALLVALHAVGAHENRPARLVLAAVVAETGVLLAARRWSDPGEFLDVIIVLTGTVTAAWILGVYQRTRRAYVDSVLERAATAERERDQQALIATVTERARIAREMHDIVAHSLSVMIALGDGAAAAVTRSPDVARESMLQSSTVGRQALAEMRRLLGNLHPDDEPDELTPPPGIADLDALVDQVRSASLAVELLVRGRPPELSAGAGLTVYRIVQEALTNVLKHARGATSVVVTLTYHSDRVDIVVDDDGTSHERAGAGRGLSGMRERAASFGGTVTSGRRPDGGWRVETHLRLDEQDTH